MILLIGIVVEFVPDRVVSDHHSLRICFSFSIAEIIVSKKYFSFLLKNVSSNEILVSQETIETQISTERKGRKDDGSQTRKKNSEQNKDSAMGRSSHRSSEKFPSDQLTLINCKDDHHQYLKNK